MTSQASLLYIRTHTYMKQEFSEEECEAYARHIIAKHLKTHWDFVWSNKMTNAFGYCYGNNRIKISRPYFNLNKAFPYIIRNVILHEVAHAMQFESMGYLSHDKHWKKFCLQIGAIPKATFNTKEVTAPCEKFALRNIFNGTVLDYISFNKTYHGIADVLKEFQLRIEQEEYETQKKVDYELVWCGK